MVRQQERLLATQIAQTLDNTGATAQTVTYNITPWTGTAPGALLCSGTPIAVVVTVEPTPVISSPNKTICDNTSTAITVVTRVQPRAIRHIIPGQ